MAKSSTKPVFDGATLSPKLKPKKQDDGSAIVLPIGKDEGAGGAKVARAYKHAAGKSNTYSPEVVDMIYHMSREGHFKDEHTAEFVEAKLLAERDMPRTPPPATWDQLVFLSANLTRLVIDPYREKCNSQLVIGADRPKPLTLDWPIILGGVELDRLPDPLPGIMERVASENNLAFMTGPQWNGDEETAPRIAIIDITAPLPDLQNVAAVELSAPCASQLDPSAIEKALIAVREATRAEIPIGISAPAHNASQVVADTVNLEIDLYVADAQWTEDARPAGIFPELSAAPAIHVLADTVEQLRLANREETVDVIYRGGIRGGGDAGKALCLGAGAICLGASAIVGMGFRITKVDDEDDLLRQISTKCDPDEVALSVHNFAKSVVMEVTMLARACGKSSVTNMEPEDLRALTIAVSAATGIPVTGKDMNFRATI